MTVVDFDAYPATLVRVIAMQDMNEVIPEAETDTRIARLADKKLSPEERNARFEELQDAIAWSEHVNSDAFDLNTVEPEERDLQTLQDKAEADIQDAIARLIGRPV